MAGIPLRFSEGIEGLARTNIGEKVERTPTGLCSGIFTGFSRISGRELVRVCKADGMAFRLEISKLSLSVFRPGESAVAAVEPKDPLSIGATLKRDWKRVGSVVSATFGLSQISMEQTEALLATADVLDVVFSEGVFRVNKVIRTAHQGGLSERVLLHKVKLRFNRPSRQISSSTKRARPMRPRRRRGSKLSSGSLFSFLSFLSPGPA